MKNFIYINKCHEREDYIRNWIASLDKKSIFYDLGANLGYFSLYAAYIGIETYAFEVDKNNFIGLESNSKNLGIKNHHIFNIGVADRKRIVNLRKFNDVIGEHRKTLDIEEFSAKDDIISQNIIEEIEVDSIDNIIQSNNLPYPDSMKIDIDGSEYAFLLGGGETLNRVNSLMIELYVKSKFHSDILNILESKGFKQKKTFPIPREEDLFNCIFEKAR